MKLRKAFTLIELLVVIAIIAILAAILFPVFAQAKISAKKAASISNAKQQLLAHLMYAIDYDDRYGLAFFSNTYRVNGTSPDSNIHYATYPYQKNYGIWSDPMDDASDFTRENEDLIPPSSLPAEFQERQRILNHGYKSDYGVNTQFMHPQGWDGSRTTHLPITQTMIGDTAKTIYMISSIWWRVGGYPAGGGNYEVDAPCIYDLDNNDLRAGMQDFTGYWWFGGWNPSQPLAWNVYGGVWPWYGDKVVVGYTDGHVKTRPITAIPAGCNVLDGHGGTVFDLNLYEWDITQ